MSTNMMTQQQTARKPRNRVERRAVVRRTQMYRDDRAALLPFSRAFGRGDRAARLSWMERVA